MRRRLIGLLALALLAAACTAGGGGSDQPAATIDPNANHAPLTLTVWSNFSARELGVVTAALKTVTQKYPWMTVKHVGSKDDQAISRAINGGTPPDVAISFTPDNAARFCDTGAWQDLNPEPRLLQDRQGPGLAGGRVQLHLVRGQAVRPADADRRLRPVLQHRPVARSRHLGAAQDHRRAGRPGQEADRVQPRRQHQGGRVPAADRALRLDHGQHLGPRLRRQVVRRVAQADPRLRPQLGQDADLAEGHGRRHRLRQAAEVRGQAGRGQLRVLGPERLRDRQDRHDARTASGATPSSRATSPRSTTAPRRSRSTPTSPASTAPGRSAAPSPASPRASSTRPSPGCCCSS